MISEGGGPAGLLLAGTEEVCTRAWLPAGQVAETDSLALRAKVKQHLLPSSPIARKGNSQ